MDSLNNSLVEVEYVLKRLDNNSSKKIPREIWEYIDKNKSKDYSYDESNGLKNLSPDAIAFLTYINMEYLLCDEAKDLMREIVELDKKFSK